MRKDYTLMRAWAIKHDSHGVCIDSLCFLPYNDEPESDACWVRLPWLDGAIQESC